MTKNRRSSIKKSNKLLKGKKGPNGYRLCRFCKKEVSPPRRTFCSDVCVHEWKIRSDAKYMRQFVYQRDLGLCAICREDTRYQKIKVEDLEKRYRVYGDKTPYFDYLKKLNITEFESKKSIWHADHILPVSMGGGETGLDNIRTLCVKCHKAETKKLPSKAAKNAKSSKNT